MTTSSKKNHKATQMLHKHCIFIPFDGFKNLKFFSQFCEKIKPDPILSEPSVSKDINNKSEIGHHD